MLSKSVEIKPINNETVHRICSGQVVLSLAIAVKELVENSIDAGATNIEIRLKNHGQDLIEVIDNGSGVQESNFTALTLKHYTSKIREFNDLENVATLGFRGEALSSLCALAELTIITRHESSEHGTKLQYDHNGHIKSQSITARSIGTTVQLANLFATLPVRRKEFTKNSKREFNKMCSLLYAYCLICANIKFTCQHQVLNNKSVILSTVGTGSVTDNIVNIFGSKQTSHLLEVALVQPNEAIANDFFLKKIPDVSPFVFDFYISSVVHGAGRSAADRQFYYINSRPCEPTKLAKLVNETYRSFNNNQYPFVYFNVKVLTSLVDVNVTPDKRQIFLEQEKLLMATVKMSLMEAFKNFPSTYKMQNLNISVGGNPEESKRKFESFNADDNDVKPRAKSFLEVFKRQKTDISCRRNRSESSLGEIKVQENVIKCPVKPKKLQKALSDYKIVKINEEPDENEITATQMKKIDETSIMLHEFLSSDHEVSNTSIVEENNEQNTESNLENLQLSPQPSTSNLSQTLDKTKIVYDSPCKNNSELEHSVEATSILNFSLDSIKKALQESEVASNMKKELIVKFRADIAPQSNKDAEQELERQFSKTMFKKMNIIGQFNHGFIIAELNRDLFIIDQHATDEKYNFEMLQRNTIIDSQTLVNPKSLQLTSVDENVLLENEKLFNKNGFFFVHNPNAPVTERVKLTKIPVSKSTIFGKDDIDEMIYMLKEGADANCRPSRIRGMFASRACRKSVMIGKSLNKSTMKKLVDHMGDIEQPWNCPHGRPTMRHLINLNLLE